MSAEASQHCANLGKVAAYAVYNIGVGIAVGLVRTIIAVAYIAKHAFYAKAYDDAQRSQTSAHRDERVETQAARRREIRQAERDTWQATGLGKLTAVVKEGATKLKHKVGEVVDDVKSEASEAIRGAESATVHATLEARQEMWYGQLVRGLSEIVYIGAPYYTYQDNFSKDHKASVYGLQELADLMEKENEMDEMIQSLLGSADYNPWF